MLKLLGGLCVASGGALAWYLQQAERRRNRRTLSDFQSALQRMGEEERPCGGLRAGSRRLFFRRFQGRRRGGGSPRSLAESGGGAHAGAGGPSRRVGPGL